MKILITGGAGQLAKAFYKLASSKGHEVFSFSRKELDISDFERVFEAVSSLKPDLIVNCAAYNLVDKAEEEFETALAVNTFGVTHLALAARQFGAFLIHFSTDYVFDGEKRALYTEEDRPNPLNKYAQSKWQGELALAHILPEKSLLFRVSWVYGLGRQNFLAKLIAWAKGRDTLLISCDEFSVPTYTGTIARYALMAFEAGLFGLFHLVSNGYCSRYEWAKRFFELLGKEIQVFPERASAFNLAAQRPFFSALSSQKLQKILGEEFPLWEDDLSRFVKEEAHLL